jgi:hypothetical protein
MQCGATTVVNGGDGDHGEDLAAGPTRSVAASHEGFNLHASVAIAAEDDLGRERLLRYGTRPAFSLERFRKLPGGRVGYLVKKARGGRETLLVLTPIELLARLAAITPPPRFPLLRYSGVLAPRHAWRKDVVPKPRDAPTHADGLAGKANTLDERPARAGKGGSGTATPSPASALGVNPTTPALSGETSRVPTFAGPARGTDAPKAGTAGPTCVAILLEPNVIAVPHWQRLQNGNLLATQPRLSWSNLLRRTFDVDVTRCAKCGGRVTLVSVVENPAGARAILERLDMPTDAPAQARARDPATLAGDAA